MSWLRAIRRRFSIQAPQVAVRPHVPWHVRWLGLTVLTGVTLALIVAAFYLGQRVAGYDRLDTAQTLKRLTDQHAELEKTNTTLQSELAVLERQVQIERAAHADLARQVKILIKENATLKEDLALFQTLSARGSGADGVGVSRFLVEPSETPGEYSYRLLLVQTGSRAKAFEGRYQLDVNLTRNGKQARLTLPDSADPGGAYRLNFRLYQRVDGVFKVAPDATVRSVQVRIYQSGQGQPRAAQTTTL